MNNFDLVLTKKNVNLKKKNLKNKSNLILKKGAVIIKKLISKKLSKNNGNIGYLKNNNTVIFLKAIILHLSVSKKKKIMYKFFKNKYLNTLIKKKLIRQINNIPVVERNLLIKGLSKKRLTKKPLKMSNNVLLLGKKTIKALKGPLSLVKKKTIKVLKRSLSLVKKKTIKILNKSLLLKKKKIELEYILNTILPFNIELRLSNFLSSKNTPSVFKKRYKNLYSIYKHKRLNFYNKQFKEVFSSLAISLLLCKSSMLMLIISRTLGNGRFRFFRRNLYFIFTNLFLLQRRVCPFNAVKVNISGKFKGKAKRTNLHYKLSPGLFNVRNFILSKINFCVGYIMTQTGIFGIKVWMS